MTEIKNLSILRQEYLLPHLVIKIRLLIIRYKKDVINGFSHNYNFYNDNREKYVSKLIKFVNSKKLKRCFITSAGTEATDIDSFKTSKELYGSSINKNKNWDNYY